MAQRTRGVGDGGGDDQCLLVRPDPRPTARYAIIEERAGVAGRSNRDARPPTPHRDAASERHGSCVP